MSRVPAPARIGVLTARSSWAKKPGEVLLHLAQCGAVAAEERDAGRFGCGDLGRERRCAVHAAEGLEVSALVDDRDRHQGADLGGTLVCAGDNCLSLLERQRHGDSLGYVDTCPYMNERIVRMTAAQALEAAMIGR
jgi:hypothetical protein